VSIEKGKAHHFIKSGQRRKRKKEEIEEVKEVEDYLRQDKQAFLQEFKLLKSMQ